MSVGRASPRRVLVVEDNDDGREMLCAALRRAGHHVDEAADGPAALETAAAHPPDVAVIDIGLPGMDGYEVTVVRDATADYSDEEMHAALDVNIPNYASTIVTTNQVVESISPL